MKPLLFTILAATLILFSCNNESQPPNKRTADTTRPLAAYLGYRLVGINYGVVMKITEDSVFTFKWNKDSTEASKVWTKQTRYIVDVPIPINSDTAAKLFQIPNWNGKDTVIYRSLWADEKHVREPVLDWKDAVKYLDKYRDTTLVKAKKDTTKIK